MDNKNFQEQITAWGRNKQTSPAKNDSLKQAIFAATDTYHGQTIKPKRKTRTWLVTGIALASTAVCVMLVFRFIRTQMVPATAVLDTMSSPFAGSASYNTSVSARGSAKQIAVDEASPAVEPIEPVSLGLSYGMETGLGSSAPNTLTENVKNIVNDIAHQAGYDTDSDTLDTREYMDTNYNISIKTRDVQEKAENARTIVRGHDGRIDHYSANKNSASVTFTVSRSKFDAMAEEIRALAFSDKFITESIYEYNRLPEKQNIEEQTEDNTKTASELEIERADLEKSHTDKTASLQKTIDGLNKQIDALRVQLATATGTTRAQISVKISALNRNLSAAKKELTAENSQYNAKIKSIDNRIKAIQNTLDNLGERDQDIIDDTNVVTGTISFRRLSILEAVNIYVPFKFSIPGLIVLIILYCAFGRKRYIRTP